MVLCLLWVVTAEAAFYLIEFSGILGQDLFMGQGTFWILIFVSLIFMALGLVIFFGQIGILFPFIFFSEEDMSEYNVEKISFILGILMVALSCMLTFVAASVFTLLILIPLAAALEILAFYTAAADRFKANAQPKH